MIGPSTTAAAVRGALVGLLLIVPISVFTAILERATDDFDDTAWPFILFVGILFAFLLAGVTAGREAPDHRFTAGILAGIGAFALWIPLRVGIWLLRDDGRGLFSGDEAVLAPGQVFVAALFAATFGLVGGLLGARRAAAEADTD